jgi:hypothetical protein
MMANLALTQLKTVAHLVLLKSDIGYFGTIWDGQCPVPTCVSQSAEVRLAGQIDQYDIGVLPDAIEEDLLAVGRNIEPTD